MKTAALLLCGSLRKESNISRVKNFINFHNNINVKVFIITYDRIGFGFSGKDKSKKFDFVKNKCLKSELLEKDIFKRLNPINLKFVNYDSYTITNETNKIQKELTNNFNKNLEKHHTKFEINNNKYTDCFTNENYNDYNKLIKSYDNICKKNIGEEYIFSNNKNNKNIKNCDKNRIKILCKPNFVEKFFNYNSNNINNKAYDNYKKRFCLLLIFIFVIITLYFLYSKYL
tara:strand:+ start:3676 stop:4362 length:687 start_codon:yes stop_codon:yes gene_type:complete